MQHHAHTPRIAPLMRGTVGHHMPPMHPSAAGGATVVPTHLGPPPPQPSIALGTQPKSQQTVQQLHTISNGPPPQPSQPNGAPGSQGPGTHMRDHHNRLTHHSHHPQSMHSSTQMQKIRQQHQHLNNNNNNNINTIKVNHQQLQQSPQYNAIQAAHIGGTQQPRNVQQQLQPQYHMSHVKTHPSATNSITTNNLSKQQQTQQILPNLNGPPLGQQQQQPPHYYGNNKHIKYTVPNVNYCTPKTILQNLNRPTKSRPQLSTVITKDANANTTNTNNITITSEHSVTPIVSANALATPTRETNKSNASEAVSSSVTVNTEDDISELPNTNALASSSTSTKSDELINNNDINGNNNNNCINLKLNEDCISKKNSKEKTPMCLVNELARFNKITHQYRLTNEKGPAHCKRFTVTLKLGEEEYSAEGFKIKKAQHLAAAEAIEKTKYKHPIAKVNRRNDEGGGSRINITPTVELNALAMKLGQQTYYLFDPRQMPPTDGAAAAPPPPDGMLPTYNAPPHQAHGSHIIPPPQPLPHPRLMDPAYIRRNGVHAAYMPPPYSHQRFCQRGYPPKYHQRYPMLPPPPPGAHNGVGIVPSHHPHAHTPFAAPPTTYKITLIVGKQKFTGLGRTLQQAKHDAAARALQVLKTQATNQLNDMMNHSLDDSDNKSPISVVYEIGIKRNMTVHFKVMREEGPAHMKNFITACIVGSIITEGEGNGKKISKKRAAEKMLEELKKLPPLTPTKSPVKRIKMKTPSKAPPNATAPPNVAKGVGGGERRKRTGASIKERLDMDLDGEKENPITRLIQLQQTRKEKEPTFDLIAKSGNENSRRREFIVEVSAQGMVARGTGNSKKLAKRNAASNLLGIMGIEDSPNSNKTPTESNVTMDTITTTDAADSNNSSLVDDANSSMVTTATEASIVSSTLTATADTDKVDVPLISTSAGHVPGILILRQNRKNASKKKENTATVNPVEAEEVPIQAAVATQNACTAIVTVAAAINDACTTSTPGATTSTAATTNTTTTSAPPKATDVESNNTTGSTNQSSMATSSSGTSGGGVHMKDQLLYLAKLMGFEVQFSDYPKGNHNEYLTIVTLSTNPPQICHGVGISAEESQNDAARSALKILSELGLSNAK